jgi:hypothetical protein
MLAAKFIPLVLLGFSAGGAARHDDGRWGDHRPFRTAHPGRSPDRLRAGGDELLTELRLTPPRPGGLPSARPQ